MDKLKTKDSGERQAIPPKLTEKFLREVRAESIRREYPDRNPRTVRGLHLIVQPKGKKSWSFRYRAQGAAKKLTLGSYPEMSLAEAQRQAGIEHGKIKAGNDPAGVKAAAKLASMKAPEDSELVETIAARFINQYVKAETRPRTARETERLLNKEILPYWKGHRLKDIDGGDVMELLDRIKERGARIVANRTHSVISKLCNWAVSKRILDANANPITGIKKLKEDPKRPRPNDDQLLALWKAADSQSGSIGPIVKALILTGQRRSEVAEMPWSELDLKAKQWTIPRERTKNHKMHIVPLSEAMMELINGLPRVNEFVFAQPRLSWAYEKEKLIKAMGGASDWTFHSLRRSFISGLARLSVPQSTAEKTVNHTSGSFGGIVGVYQDYDFLPEKTDAMERWGRYITRLVKGGDDNVVDFARRAL
jgi:integrase